MDLITQAQKGGGIYFFSIDGCRYCKALADLFTEIGLPYRAIKVPTDAKKAVASYTGMKTFPMLYFGSECIGGYDDFCQLVNFQADVLQQKLIANNIKTQPKLF